MHVLLVGTAVVCQYIHSFYFLGVCYKAVVLWYCPHQPALLQEMPTPKIPVENTQCKIGI